MSKHDSWVYLIPNSPFQTIVEMFSEGFPARDPFPMPVSDGIAANPKWLGDFLLDARSYRMSSTQVVLPASVLAEVGEFVGQLGRLQWMPRTQQINRL
jgi:hypothetical protein